MNDLLREESDHHLDALVGALLVVALRTLYRVEQTVAVVGYAFQRVVYAVILPAILQQQHL